VKFASPITARTYSDRAVDRSWNDWALRTLKPSGKDVVDIGCGGGIYSYGFAAIGARSVTGIDSSNQYIDEANVGLSQSDAISFMSGNALSTSLQGDCADIVFERALIHHLTEPEMAANAAEAKRLLRSGGLFVVQDRTIEDVESSDPQHWIRATLFETFPRLVDFERARRPSRQRYARLLVDSGFKAVREVAYEEVRKTYSSFAQLRDEVLSRKGKSILFELSDVELEGYCARLREKAANLPLVERDPWTVWLATR
jgi:ubiquinone/menaquinone biosynthesis C-methylase UbiE